MKPAKSSLIITLSFLLSFSLTTTKPSSLASAVKPVTDINGDPLVDGQKYYVAWAIAPGFRTDAVTTEKTGDSSCSYSVVTRRYLDCWGDNPVKLHIPTTSTGTIYENSTFVEIEFANKPECAESSEWVAAFARSGSSSSSPAKLVIGGPQDHPNSFVVPGYFRIKKYGLLIGYQLVFCPKAVHSFSICHNVGRADWQLTLEESNEPAFMVVFKKADDSAKGMSII